MDCSGFGDFLIDHDILSVVDLERGRASSAPPPWETDKATDRRRHVLVTSENGSVLWRRHRQLTYKHVTATLQSLSLSSNTSCKDDTKSQG